MCATVFAMPHWKGFWASARASVQAYFDVPAPSRIMGRRHHILYLDRQDTKRRLSDRDHQALLHTMEALVYKRGATFEQALLSNKTEAEMIHAASRATVSEAVVPADGRS